MSSVPTSKAEVERLFGEITLRKVAWRPEGDAEQRTGGEAFVQLDPTDAAQAPDDLRDSRFVEVFPASAANADRNNDRPETGASSESSASPPTQKQAFVKLRGLPFASTSDKVLEFLGPDVDVLNGAEGVIILSDEEGRPLGEALVELASEQAQQRAMQSRHKATMGGRYVELYASSKAVFDQARRSSGRTAGSPRRAPERSGRGRDALPLIPPPPPPRSGALSAAVGHGGPPDTQATLKLRGLPYSAGVDDITEWLAGFKLADDGVKIVTQLDSSGRPLNSGLAYVRFESAAEAQRAAAMQHRKTMGNRYIECLPVSPTQRMPPRLPIPMGMSGYGVIPEYGRPERMIGTGVRPAYIQDTRRRPGGSPHAYVSAQAYTFAPQQQQQQQQQQHYYMHQQQYMMQQGMRPYAGAWVPQQLGPAGGGHMMGPTTYAGGAHWFPPPPPGQPGGPRGYAAVQGGAMHPGFAGGYAVSMYAGMGPYPTMMPQAAPPYPTSPVLNPAVAAAPTTGFSVPSSSNSSRKTSLSEPMPRLGREKRSSATGSASFKEPQLDKEAPVASDAAVRDPS